MAKDTGFRADTGDDEGGVVAAGVDAVVPPKGKPRPEWWGEVKRHENGTIYRDSPTYRRLLAAQKK